MYIYTYISTAARGVVRNACALPTLGHLPISLPQKLSDPRGRVYAITSRKAHYISPARARNCGTYSGSSNSEKSMEKENVRVWHQRQAIFSHAAVYSSSSSRQVISSHTCVKKTRGARGFRVIYSDIFIYPLAAGIVYDYVYLLAARECAEEYSERESLGRKGAHIYLRQILAHRWRQNANEEIRTRE